MIIWTFDEVEASRTIWSEVLHWVFVSNSARVVEQEDAHIR
jgi:hypothetical protein